MKGILKLLSEIPQSCWGKANVLKNQVLYVAGMSSCCGVIIFHKQTGEYAITHMDEANIESRPFDTMIDSICPNGDIHNIVAYITETESKFRAEDFNKPIYLMN